MYTFKTLLFIRISYGRCFREVKEIIVESKPFGVFRFGNFELQQNCILWGFGETLLSYMAGVYKLVSFWRALLQDLINLKTNLSHTHLFQFSMSILKQRSKNFSLKGQMVTILDFICKIYYIIEILK